MRTHTIDYYRGRLRVSKHHLDDELEEHSELLDQIGQEVSLANSAVLAAKDKLSKVEARVADRVRQDYEKLAAAAVDAKVRRDPERTEAYDRWMECRELHEQWVSLHEAWKGRGYSMKTLADLYAGQYFALKSAGTGRRELNPRSYEEGRAAMREATPTTRRRVVE